MHKRTDTAVDFIRKYSKVSISMWNAVWAGNESRTSKDREAKIFLWVERFLKIFLDELDN